MAKRKITEKERTALVRWDRFCTEQSGVYPSNIAAIKLGMSPAGVYQAAQRGWIAFFQFGRDRWYSRRDVSRYAEHISLRKNMVAYRADSPKDFSLEDDGGASRGHVFVQK